MKLTWLGQGGFLFVSEGFRLAVDPYLSDFVERKQGLTRLTPPPMDAEELSPVVVVCTHDHPDHLDPVLIAHLVERTDCLLAGPGAVQERLRKMGAAPGRILPLSAGQQSAAGPFQLRALHASHGATEAVSLLLRAAGQSVYLTGDTLYTRELTASACEFAAGVDLLLVCINGKWGNMDHLQAALLAALLAPRTVAPMHYGLFAENTVDPAAFLARCDEAGMHAVELHVGAETDLADLRAN